MWGICRGKVEKMKTFYVEIINKTDCRDNESRRVYATNKKEAYEKVNSVVGSNFYIGRCVAARGEDKDLVREFKSYCGGTIK